MINKILSLFLLLQATASLAVAQYGQYKVGYEPNTNTWYHTTVAGTKGPSLMVQSFPQGPFDFNVLVEIISSDRMRRSQFTCTSCLFPYTVQTVMDTTGAMAFYNWGPGLISMAPFSQFTTIDSLSFGGNITDFHPTNPNNGWAILANSHKNYLFRKQNGAWSLNPVLTKDQPNTPFHYSLWGFTIAALLGLLYVHYRCRQLRQQIAANIERLTEENALLTKSEKPLSLSDEDLLGFSSIEAAITRIIRNPQLELPMAIVISGTWGSGKSSMMNRIRQSLQQPPLDRRFMTTWFNAWHVQNEASLLNTFLLKIIGAYEFHYKFYSPFRVRLAWSRYSKLPFWKKLGFGFAAFLILPFLLLIILQILPVSNPRSLDWVDSYCVTLSNIFRQLGNFTPGMLTPVGASLLIVFSLVFLNRQFVPSGLSAFFELLPKNNFSLEVEKQDTGSREKFRQQYWQIMEAGRKDTRLVVFIDDLDRIEGDKILELLEGINFISDVASRPEDISPMPPNTIFILGMYTQEVARQVGAQLNKVNQSSIPDQALGALYIEKMVQLIVPVPFDSDNQEKLKRLYEN